MFPFLIGRIRTSIDNKNKGGRNKKFPFLIGRIRTKEFAKRLVK